MSDKDEGDGGTPPRSFTRIPINLLGARLVVPTLVSWVYAGRLTVLQSEPGVGKSWLAAWISDEVMRTGRDVIYMDEEGGPEVVTDRLRALGADPAVVAEHFWYYAFEGRRWGWGDLEALGELVASVPDPALATMDSVPDFLAAANLSEDSAQDVTRFVNTVCGRFRQAGVAQLLLDHLVKPSTDQKPKRSRYARGSGAKLAKSDATLLIETGEEFDARTSGRIKLWKTKDRFGLLELPTQAKAPLDIAVTVGAGTIGFAPLDKLAVSWDGPTECMAKVLALLQAHPHERYSKNRLEATMDGFRAQTIRAAAERLADEGAISGLDGPRGARVFSWPAVDLLGEDF